MSTAVIIAVAVVFLVGYLALAEAQPPVIKTATTSPE